MGLLDDLVGGAAGLLGLGGGSGASTTYGVVTTIQGGDKPVQVASTIGGGDQPIEIDSGLDDINIDVGGTGQPLHWIAELRVPDPIKTETDVDFDFAVVQPIVSDITSKLDVEPLQVDVCLNVGLTRLPKACIRQPYESHFGVSLLGTELIGFDWIGEFETAIGELTDSPHVEPGRPRPSNQSRPPPGHALDAGGRSGEGDVRIRVG
jgi:hypothetical protein